MFNHCLSGLRHLLEARYAALGNNAFRVCVAIGEVAKQAPLCMCSPAVAAGTHCANCTACCNAKHSSSSCRVDRHADQLVVGAMLDSCCGLLVVQH